MPQTRAGLSDELLAQARERALAAGPLPDEVRARYLALWSVQGKLQRDVTTRSLAQEAAGPSHWAVTYATPALADHLAMLLRREPAAATTEAAALLAQVAELLRQGDVTAGVALLLGHARQGSGKVKARRAVHLTLRTLDLGLVGSEVGAALLAQWGGVGDLAVENVAAGTLDSAHAMELAALTLGGAVEEPGEEQPLLLYRELLAPDDLDPVRVEAVPPVVGGLDHDSVDEQSQ